jgi:hemin uptake protein HemP
MDILGNDRKMNARSEQENHRTSAREPVASPSEERKIHVTDHRIDSRDIFINTREITISHGSEIYRLRLTAQNKLILTK